MYSQCLWNIHICLRILSDSFIKLIGCLLSSLTTLARSLYSCLSSSERSLQSLPDSAFLSLKPFSCLPSATKDMHITITWECKYVYIYTARSTINIFFVHLYKAGTYQLSCRSFFISLHSLMILITRSSVFITNKHKEKQSFKLLSSSHAGPLKHEGAWAGTGNYCCNST